MADVTGGDGSLTSWVQTGGVLAFAGAVLYQLRELKPVLKEVGEILSQVRSTLAALLERERARAERIAAQDALRARGDSRSLLGEARVVEVAPEDEDFTGPIDVQRVKAATPPRGLPYVQHNRPKTSGGG
jgi:hypothetical protein